MKTRCTKCGMEIEETKYTHRCIDKFGNFRSLVIPIIKEYPREDIEIKNGFAIFKEKPLDYAEKVLAELQQQEIDEAVKIIWKYGDIL